MLVWSEALCSAFSRKRNINHLKRITLVTNIFRLFLYKQERSCGLGVIAKLWGGWCSYPNSPRTLLTYTLMYTSTATYRTDFLQLHNFITSKKCTTSKMGGRSILITVGAFGHILQCRVSANDSAWGFNNETSPILTLKQYALWGTSTNFFLHW